MRQAAKRCMTDAAPLGPESPARRRMPMDRGTMYRKEPRSTSHPQVRAAVPAPDCRRAQVERSMQRAMRRSIDRAPRVPASRASERQAPYSRCGGAPRCNPAVVWQYRLREVQRDAEPCRHPDRGPHGRTSRTRLRRDLDSPVPRSRELCPYHLQRCHVRLRGKRGIQPCGDGLASCKWTCIGKFTPESRDPFVGDALPPTRKALPQIGYEPGDFRIVERRGKARHMTVEGFVAHYDRSFNTA